jgi:hypothetical protein
MNRAQQTLLYAEGTLRAADTAMSLERAARVPFTNDPLKRMKMEATKDDAMKSRRKARTAAWEATVAFCELNGIKL